MWLPDRYALQARFDRFGSPASLAYR